VTELRWPPGTDRVARFARLGRGDVVCFFAGRRRAIMAGAAAGGHARMVEPSPLPTARGVTSLAIIAAHNVLRWLAHLRLSIVAGLARPLDICVVKADQRPSRRAVTGVATGRRRRMSRVLSACLHIVVATIAPRPGNRRQAMVDPLDLPVASCMAITTRARRCDMIGRLTNDGRSTRPQPGMAADTGRRGPLEYSTEMARFAGRFAMSTREREGGRIVIKSLINPRRRARIRGGRTGSAAGLSLGICAAKTHERQHQQTSADHRHNPAQAINRTAAKNCVAPNLQWSPVRDGAA
jgi:hypothetical protein